MDWGDAPEGPSFYGRESELALLTAWLLEQNCHVVSILGMGGMGKSRLVHTFLAALEAHTPGAFHNGTDSSADSRKVVSSSRRP